MINDYQEYEQEAAQVLPHSESAEQALLGALLQDSTLIQDLPPGMDEGALYAARHRRIFKAIKHVAESGHRADPISVAERLSQVDNSDPESDYLVDLVLNTTGSNVLAWSQIILNKKLDRDIINAGMLIQQMGYRGEESSEDKLAEVGSIITALDTVDAVERKDCNAMLKQAVQVIDSRFRGKEPLGLDTGFTDMDETVKMRPGNMVVIAGRPSQGKTTYAMNVASNVAINGGNVLIFSLEMTSEELMDGVLSSVGGIDLEKILSGKLGEEDWPRLEMAYGKLKNKKLNIIDKSGLNVYQYSAIAKKYNRKDKLDLVVFDYLQLIKGGDKENKTQQITDITNQLKTLAKDLGCPVIAISQLNRNCETRQDKRPVMSDLRESGAIEQDADIIIFLYRDEYYHEDSQFKGIAELILAKQRRGKTGTVRLVSQLHLSRFVDLSPSYQPPTPPKSARFEYE